MSIRRAHHAELLSRLNFAKQQAPIQTDMDVLRNSHRFIHSVEEDTDNDCWETRLALKYYRKLFKEYALCSLSHYKSGRFALRWRRHAELVVGKGQFICGNLDCATSHTLTSYEVNFAYEESGESKNALVKLRLCEDCGGKLNYRANRDREKLRKRKRRTSNGPSPKDFENDAPSPEEQNDIGHGEKSVRKSDRSETVVEDEDVWKFALKFKLERGGDIDGFVKEMI